MDIEILQLVGKEAEPTSELKIQEEVKMIWRKFMSEDLPETVKTSITAKYPKEGNLYAKTPNINLEVQSVLTEIAKTRPTFWQYSK